MAIENIKIGVLVEKGFSSTKEPQKEAGCNREAKDNIVFVDRESHKQFVHNIFSILEKE